MASTKALRVLSDELTEVLGLDEGRIAAKLPALSGLKGKPLADALLAEAEDIYTTDTISEESVKVLKTLGWTGPKEPPVEDGDDENKSNLPLPDINEMDHDDLLEELEHLGATIPKALRKESTKTMAKLQILVAAARPTPKEEKPAKTEKNLPYPDIYEMDHDDLLEELRHRSVKIPMGLNKENKVTTAKLRILVTKNRPAPKEEKEAVKKEKAVKKETTKKAGVGEKKVPTIKKGDVQRESVRTALLNTKAGLTIEELMKKTGIEHMKVCRNWLSYLKNPKYAGKLGVITITKDDKKRYKGS